MGIDDQIAKSLAYLILINLSSNAIIPLSPPNRRFSDTTLKIQELFRYWQNTVHSLLTHQPHPASHLNLIEASDVEG